MQLELGRRGPLARPYRLSAGQPMWMPVDYQTLRHNTHPPAGRQDAGENGQDARATADRASAIVIERCNKSHCGPVRLGSLREEPIVSITSRPKIE
jgi:hypothetical protein